MKTLLNTLLLLAGLGIGSAHAQGPVRLSDDPVLVPVVRDAETRIRRAAADMGYAKHTLFLRAIAVESDPKRSVGTMNDRGVAMINATRARGARLSDADIAWIVAHEFAHFILGHAAGAGGSHALESAGEHGGAHAQARELEADLLGLRLALAAGYAFDARGFFTRLHGDRPTVKGKTHPADGVRVKALQNLAARGI